MQPLCFVLMPFGRKADGLGRIIDFDAIYCGVISPAITASGLEPIRADEEQLGGSIHKPMFERLILCDYAIADLTGANPNVYYELGIRHGLRPHTTIMVFAEGTPLPFDLASIRGMPYKLDERGAPANLEADIAALGAKLSAARHDKADDSPLFQLVADLPRIEFDRSKADIFRSQVEHSRAAHERLARAREAGAQGVRAAAAELSDPLPAEIETGVLFDLLLSFRAVEAFEDIVTLHASLPKPLQRQRLVREQLAFALNRLGRRTEAERALLGMIREFGPASETCGLLGRVYKDMWRTAVAGNQRREANGFLRKAIDQYVRGFEADWRDPFPGVNAVALMAQQIPPDPRLSEMLPVVRYAALRRARTRGSYWDHATLLEVAVLAGDAEAAEVHLADALAVPREGWAAESTAQNIEETATYRGDTSWIAGIVATLRASGQYQPA